MNGEFHWVKWYQKYRWLLHAVFWTLMAAMYFLTYDRVAGLYAYLFVFKELFSGIIVFYIFGYFIVPNFLRQGHWWVVVIYVILSYVGWCSITYLFCRFLREDTSVSEQFPYIKSYLDYMLAHGYWGLIFNRFSSMIMDFAYLMVMPLSIKLTKELVSQNNEKVKLERDHLRMEINFLKSQINPHFLLNSLNTINALVDQEHPYTQESIGVLGSILSYTLYTQPHEKIPLRKEIDVIKDYLTMQEYRFGERVEVVFESSEIGPEYSISPHILFPFVENAFKHGVEKIRTQAFLHIDLKLDNDGNLAFEVRNNFPESVDNKMVGGIGIENVKRRLEIFYSGRYDLKVEVKNSVYRIRLALKP